MIISKAVRARILLLLGAILLGFITPSGAVYAQNWTPPGDQISEWVGDEWKESGIPGMSVAVVDRSGIIFSRNYGYADRGRTNKVTSETTFELASLSKAFTGLAVLKLEKEGKLKLSDPVSRYLPWFHVTYKDTTPTITVGELLYQTGGVPFNSIGFIPEGSGGTMLEQTARTLIDTELDHKPGSKFLYATINYAVLGLIVEKASGKPFDDYLQQQVIAPLGLGATYAGYGKLNEGATVSQGFKRGFLSWRPYDAPAYDGNTPAAYVLTNAQDMARWIQIQMGAVQDINFDSELIKKSHQPDRTVLPNFDGSSYGAGWAVFQKGGGEWSHGGTNPTFSSYIVIRPEEQIGVIVLANANSEFTARIGQGIMDKMLGVKVIDNSSDYYSQIDSVAMCMLLFALLAGTTIIYAFGRAVVEAVNGKRRYSGSGKKIAIPSVMTVLSAAVCLAGVYFLPDLLFWELPWRFVEVWASPSVMAAVYAAAGLTILYAIYAVFCRIYSRPKERTAVTIVLVSMLSGFGNAFIVFMINESFRRSGDGFETELFMYFVMGIMFYVYAQKVVRTKMVRYTNEVLFEKRMNIVDRILESRFSQLEKIDQSVVNSALISDTETISNSINVAISGITSMITLLFCFIYLGFLNFYGLLISVGIILVAGGVYYFAASKVNKLWEFTRNVQNTFFRFAGDLTKGFKELSLHIVKRREFRSDMENNGRLYKDKRSEGDLMFANVYVFGELLFTIVIGVVAFIFPVIFKQMGADTLRNYVFVFLYMTGAINGVLNAIPQILSIRISWNRIKGLLSELDEGKAVSALGEPASTGKLGSSQGDVALTLEQVAYHYGGESGSAFSLGPIDYTFRTGSIVFITGGNGSGKSTLAKVFTGLCQPDEGAIAVNGRRVDTRDLGELFSAVFSDFHLFDRLYGIATAGREQEIADFLSLLQLEDKVTIKDGSFSTTKLSTGQRKRLALLLCYLDDRPFYLFDEWAADQDPEYREFFYTHLMKEMKRSGKGVIAITHDDRYFHLADHVLKLEFGQVVRMEQFAL